VRPLSFGPYTRAKGAKSAWQTIPPTPNRFARDPQRRMTAGTAIGMNALKPIVHFQVSLLRMWADSIERFAGNHEKALE
jgi:hypothetical protein